MNKQFSKMTGLLVAGVSAVLVVGALVTSIADKAFAQPANSSYNQYFSGNGLVVDSGTNQVIAASTWNQSFGTGGLTGPGPVAEIDCRGGKELGLMIKFKQPVAGTTNLYLFTFQKGFKTTHGNVQTNYDSGQITYTIAGTSTTNSILTTNITMNGLPTLYLTSISTTNVSAYITNIEVWANIK